MSGLLRRLASQTIGGGQPAIRPLARLPWAAPLELAENTVADTGHGLPAVWRAAPGEPPGEPSRVQPPETLTQRSPRDASPPEPLVRPTALDPSFATQTADAQAAGAPPPRLARTRAADTAAAPRETARRPDLPMVATRAPQAPRPPEQPVAPGPERPRPVNQTAGAFIHLPAPLVEATALPARDQAPASPRIETASRGNASRVSAHEPSEVHVHIGRIEVTAVHEAPPAREKKRAARQPMSLEAYLAKRHGRTG